MHRGPGYDLNPGGSKGVTNKASGVHGALARGALVMLVGRAGGRAAQLIGQALVARLLGPAQFGLYAIGWALMRIVGGIAPLGADSGVIKFGQQYQEHAARLRGLVLECLLIAGAVSAILATTVAILAPSLASHVFHTERAIPVLRVFALGFVGVSMLRVASASSQVTGRMGYSVLAEELTPPLVVVAAVAILFVLHGGVLDVAWVTVLAFFVGLAVALFFLPRVIPAIAIRSLGPRFDLREVLTFSAPASLASMLTLLTTRLDRLIVGALRPLQDVGVYQASTQIAVLFGIILSAVGAIFSVTVANLHHAGRRDELDEAFKVTTKWALYLSLPLFAVIALRPSLVLGVVYGAAYRAGGTTLTILAVGQLVNAGTGAVGAVLVMSGHQRAWAAVSASVLIANVAVNLLLVPGLGPVGSAIGMTVSMLLLFGSGLRIIRRRLGIWPYDYRYWKGIVAGAVAILAVAIFGTRVPGTLVGLVGLAVGSVGLFSVCLVVLGLDDEDHALLRMATVPLVSAMRRSSE